MNYQREYRIYPNKRQRDLNASINILNEGLKKYNLRSGGPITHGDSGHDSVLDRECINLYISAASII